MVVIVAAVLTAALMLAVVGGSAGGRSPGAAERHLARFRAARYPRTIRAKPGPCSASSGSHSCTTPCNEGMATSTKRASLRLALTDRAPSPRTAAMLDAVVEVVSSFRGNRMTLPAAHPASAVCEISSRRGKDGSATAVYRLVGKGTITFFSTYAQPTDLFMPAMLGRLVTSSAGPGS